MPRGGSRQGTPGKGYANRTDLTSSYDQGKNTAAAGGRTAPPPAQPSEGPPEPQGGSPILPDQIPGLMDPTQFPEEPITAGLMSGPGPGPSRDNRLEETRSLQRWLPLLSLYLDEPDTPDSVRALFRYIRGT